MVAISADAVSRQRATRLRLVLFTMCLGVLIAQLDTSVVNLALRPIGADLYIGVSTLQWVVDAYNLVYASLLLTAGTLGDLYGRKLAFALGVTVFALGSLMCGSAPAESILIAGRAVTGLGAALMLPTSLAILAVTYPDAKERAQAIGIWASCYGLAMAVGPTFGGLLVEIAGWRSIFLIVVPVAVLALAMTLRFLPESQHSQGRRLDLPGQVLAMIALGTLTLVAIEFPHWSRQATLLCAGASVVAMMLFLAVEARTDGALLPLEFLSRRGLPATMMVASLMTFGMYAMLFLMPLYWQTQQGASVFTAGLELLPMSVPFLLVSQRSGPWATRLGPRAVMTAGMALMGAGLLLLALLSPDTSPYVVEADLAILGIGLGLNTGPVNSVAVASVPPARSGTASGLLNTARMVGATLGVAILGAVFASHAEQGSPAGFFAGLRGAFLIGGAGEMLGALIALCFIRRDALSRASES
jgi:DHA2 family methylenomycin A resistance protein-like MFS transporter